MNKLARITTDGNVCVLQADTLHSDGKSLHVLRTHESGGKITEELIGYFKLSEVKSAYISTTNKRAADDA